MSQNPQFSEELVTFTEKILNEKPVLMQWNYLLTFIFTLGASWTNVT